MRHFGFHEVLTEDGGGDVIDHLEGGRRVRWKSWCTETSLARWKRRWSSGLLLLLLVEGVGHLLDGVVEIGVVGAVVRADPGPGTLGGGERC